MMRPALAALALLLAACAPDPEPPALPSALPAPTAGAAAAMFRPLRLPADLAVIRIAGGRITPVPATERGRWRGALHQVNRSLLYPIRLRQLPFPLALAPQEGDLGAGLAMLLDAAAQAGIDAVLIYELSVRVEDDYLPAGLSALPLLGGIVPGTLTTDAQAHGLAVLVEPASRAVLGFSEARLQGAPVARLADTGGDGDLALPMAEYAMLHALAPRAEDLLTEAASMAY